MSQLSTGKHYSTLKNTFIIFICMTDSIGIGESVYTVQRVCKENAAANVDNGSCEVYLNASAWKKEKDVALRSFLRYIYTREATDDLTQQLDKEIAEQKTREEVIKMYCEIDSPVYLAREEGYDKGRDEGIAWQKAQSEAQIARMAQEIAALKAAMPHNAAQPQK